MDCLQTIADGYADRILSIDTLPLHRLHGAFPPPAADLEFWRSFDRIISWTGAGEEPFCRNLARAGSNVITAPWRPEREEPRHVAQIFIDSLRPWLSLPERAEAAMVSPGDADRAGAIHWLQRAGFGRGERTVAIHTGAGSPAKRWPMKKFQRLASELVCSSGCHVLAIEGPADFGLGRALADSLPPSSCRLAAGLPLKQLSSIISCCRGFIGNDSGLAHLAAALGISCALIFGPTRPEHWAPLGENVTVLRDDEGFRTLSADRVLETAMQLIH
jgi:hypothetical protein